MVPWSTANAVSVLPQVLQSRVDMEASSEVQAMTKPKCKQRVCSECKGCPLYYAWTADGYVISPQRCPACNGTGYVPEAKGKKRGK